jgi:hypothetical protein
MNKRLLQGILGAIAIFLIAISVWGLIAGVRDAFYAVNVDSNISGNIILDSNLRFYYGLTIGLGIMLCWIIPSIERRKTILRFAALMIFIGGLGRVISIVTVGLPTALFCLFTLLELIFPVFVLWQKRVEQSATSA